MVVKASDLLCLLQRDVVNMIILRCNHLETCLVDSRLNLVAYSALFYHFIPTIPAKGCDVTSGLYN